MSEVLEKPLVTFALVAYNQAQYVQEAVESALAQDYPNLEIILSDDCSTDGTLEIINDAVSRYGGSALVRVVQNARNLGIGAHVNAVLKMCRGAIVILAAGDDISLPNRTSKTVERFANRSHPVDAVTVELAEIDQFGRATGAVRNKFVVKHQICAATLAGAGMAYSRSVIDRFGEISGMVKNEDVVLVARAYLLSDVGFICEPLVMYRSHPTNRPKRNGFRNLGREWLRQKRAQLMATVAMADQVERDARGQDFARIPYYYELLRNRRAARTQLAFFGRDYPLGFSDLVAMMLHPSIGRSAVLILTARFIALFRG